MINNKQHITDTMSAILVVILLLLCRQACCMNSCESNYDCDATDSFCHKISSNCVKCVTIPCDPMYMEQEGHAQCIRFCPDYYKAWQQRKVVAVPMTTDTIHEAPKAEAVVQEKFDTKVIVILPIGILCGVLISIGIILWLVKRHNKIRNPQQEVYTAVQESSAHNEGQNDDFKDNP